MVENPISNIPKPAILMPLPDHDFDPIEAAIPWKACNSQGWAVTISTEHGSVAECDMNRMNGPLPGIISPGKAARSAYQLMSQDPRFQHPIPYNDIDPEQFQALLLPGGDGLRMRQYLESAVLQAKVLQFFQQNKLVGAICHGTLVLARTIDPQTGRSVLYGRKITILPSSLDRLAYRLDAWITKHGYIMYPQCVADEVRACLEHPGDFIRGPGLFSPYVYKDSNLITSRTYLDAEVFAQCFVQALHPNIPIKYRSLLS